MAGNVNDSRIALIASIGPPLIRGALQALHRKVASSMTSLSVLVLLSYPALLFWAFFRGRLFASDFVTLFGAAAFWFLLISARVGHVASLSNLLELLMIIAAAPALFAIRLFCIDFIWRDASRNSGVVAGIAIFAVILLRMLMPTLPE